MPTELFPYQDHPTVSTRTADVRVSYLAIGIARQVIAWEAGKWDPSVAYRESGF